MTTSEEDNAGIIAGVSCFILILCLAPAFCFKKPPAFMVALNGGGNPRAYRWFDKIVGNAAMLVTAAVSFVGLLSWQTDSILGFNGGPYSFDYQGIEDDIEAWKGRLDTCQNVCPGLGVNTNSIQAYYNKINHFNPANGSWCDLCTEKGLGSSYVQKTCPSQAQDGLSGWIDFSDGNNCEYLSCKAEFYDAGFYALIWVNATVSLLFFAVIIYLVSDNDAKIDDTDDENDMAARGQNTSIEFFADAIGWASAYGTLRTFQATFAHNTFYAYNPWTFMFALYGYVIIMAAVLHELPQVWYWLKGMEWDKRGEKKRDAVIEFVVGNCEIVVGQTFQSALRSLLTPPSDQAAAGGIHDWGHDEIVPRDEYNWLDFVIAVLLLLIGCVLIPAVNYYFEGQESARQAQMEQHGVGPHFKRLGLTLKRLTLDTLSRLFPFAGCWWIVMGIRTNQHTLSAASGLPCEDLQPYKTNPPQIASAAHRFVIGMITITFMIALFVIFDFMKHMLTRKPAHEVENDETNKGEEDPEATADDSRFEKVLDIVQNKVVVKYGRFISNQMWWRFMAQACAVYMNSSKVQFAMATTGFAVIISELLANVRSMDDVYAASTELVRASIGGEEDTDAAAPGAEVVDGKVVNQVVDKDTKEVLQV